MFFKCFTTFRELEGRLLKRHTINALPNVVNDILIDQFDWTYYCSFKNSIVIIICFGLSLIFTAFDSDISKNLLQKVSLFFF